MRKVGTSKVSGQRAYDLMRSTLGMIKEVLHMAELCKMSQSQTLESMNERVFKGPHYSRLPEAEKSYLNGYKDALYEAMGKKHLFVYEVDGERLTCKECRAKEVPYNKMMHENSMLVWESDRTKVWYSSKE